MKGFIAILFVIVGLLAVGVWMNPPDSLKKWIDPLKHGQPESVEQPASEPDDSPTVFETHQSKLKETPSVVKSEPVNPEVNEAPETAVVEAPVVETVPKEDAPPPPMETRILVGQKAVDVVVLDQDLEKTIEEANWQAYHDQLYRSLSASIDFIRAGSEQDSYDPVWSQELFYQHLLRWRVLNTLQPSLWEKSAEYSYASDLARWMFRNNEAMEELLFTVNERDDLTTAFSLLARFWGSHDIEPKLAPKYFNLALACALVFDRTISYTTPEDSGNTTVDPELRYQWYVEKNEKHLLDVKIDRSSARDLVFVVAAPVTEKELDWALKEFRGKRRKSWAENYGAVKYLMERAVEGLDPYDEYTLEQILKEGGICGDQTYFCVNTARATGIPAFGLSGVTDAGGHAWAAIMLDENEWSTKVGRIGGVSQGRGQDPQTGEAISEQEVWMWSTRDYQDRKTQLRVHRHFWLGDLLKSQQRNENYSKAILAAFRFGKSYPIVWEHVYRMFESSPEYTSAPKDPATLERWRDFTAQIRKEFKENPRMSGLANEVEDKHIFPHAELKDIRQDLVRERRRQHREAAEQTDLVADSIRREAEFILSREKENPLGEISRIYENALREYGSSITGFQTLADDYFRFTKNDQELARKAVRNIELAFKRVVDTGTTDWFRAKTEVDLHKRICEMYRQVGEEKLAEILEKRLERHMEKAKRRSD